MIKFFSMQYLYEEMESKHNTEAADKLDEKISKCELLRINNETYRAYYLERNEKELIKQYPELKELNVIRDFETLIEWDFEIDEIEVAGIVIDYTEIQEKASDYFMDCQNVYKLWDAEDIDKEIENLKDRFINQTLREKLNNLLWEIKDSNYNIDWNDIMQTIKEIKAE